MLRDHVRIQKSPAGTAVAKQLPFESKVRRKLRSLERLARGTDKLAQCGDIRPIRAEACRIDRQSEALCRFDVNSSVVKLREAKPNGRQHAMNSRCVHGSRRAMPLPGTICDCEKLVPVVFIPHGSRVLPRAFKCYFFKYYIRSDAVKHATVA